MSKFRVALSGHFRDNRGTPALPNFDLRPLEADSDIEYFFVDGDADTNTMTAASLEGVDALILLDELFSRDSIPSDGRLSIVARFGVGFDSVDVTACTANGIAVGITPDGVRRPVAVSVLTFILALAGRLLEKDALVRSHHDFSIRGPYMGQGLVGKTLASVGLGNIGAEIFRLCQPLDMNFIAHDPWADSAVAVDLGVELVDLDAVFQQGDFVTLNTPYSPETHHLVNSERLALMKPSAYLINTSRGGVVDQTALVESLKLGAIAGAGLDVFDPEPPQPNEPLLELDNVILAPHALCFTEQCVAGIGANDIRIILSIKQGEVPDGLVDSAVAESLIFRDKLEIYRELFS